jgi:hypothetical protein
MMTTLQQRRAAQERLQLFHSSMPAVSRHYHCLCAGKTDLDRRAGHAVCRICRKVRSPQVSRTDAPKCRSILPCQKRDFIIYWDVDTKCTGISGYQRLHSPQRSTRTSRSRGAVQSYAWWGERLTQLGKSTGVFGISWLRYQRPWKARRPEEGESAFFG